MERLKHMEETLMSCVESQLGHLDCVNTEELGQAIDMIKDLEQAKYYCSVVKAMKETTEHDFREGKSPKTRRMYMESKQLHKDKEEKMRELEKYMQELSEDIVEMIDGASIEERQILERKMNSLVSKIAQLNSN